MLQLAMYIMYIIVTNQVICDGWKGPSDRNAFNIINSNFTRSTQWWQILWVNVDQIALNFFG